jgi:hypothetical protein
LSPGNLVYPRRRTQTGHFQLQLLVQFGGLGALRLEQFHPITKLEMLEVLPGVKQNGRGE